MTSQLLLDGHIWRENKTFHQRMSGDHKSNKNMTMKLNYVQISINRTDFITKHKLSPVNLTWLFQVYGKMFFFPIG